MFPKLLNLLSCCFYVVVVVFTFLIKAFEIGLLQEQPIIALIEKATYFRVAVKVSQIGKVAD